jgi:hypothetical protein
VDQVDQGDQMSTEHSETVHLSGRDLALLEAAAELEELSLSEYLRAAGIVIAQEVLGLEVYSPTELAQRLYPAGSAGEA